MAESSRRYNLRDTRKKPQGVLLKRWEMEFSKLINNENIRIPLETVKAAIRSAFEDGMFEQWRITLKCPLSAQRISVPARYADCTHIECFDLETFLRMKTQKNIRVCPICQKEVEKPLANLRIDKYMENVLPTLSDTIQVELMPDGSFTEVHEELVIEPNVIDDEDPYIQNVKKEALEESDEYITLSDGEDEFMLDIPVIDMKPISLMPLNVDIKPNIAASSVPEQIHSRKDRELQGIESSIPFVPSVVPTTTVKTEQIAVDPITNHLHCATPTAVILPKREPPECVSSVPMELRLQATLTSIEPTNVDSKSNNAAFSEPEQAYSEEAQEIQKNLRAFVYSDEEEKGEDQKGKNESGSQSKDYILPVARTFLSAGIVNLQQLTTASSKPSRILNAPQQIFGAQSFSRMGNQMPLYPNNGSNRRSDRSRCDHDKRMRKRRRTSRSILWSANHNFQQLTTTSSKQLPSRILNAPQQIFGAQSFSPMVKPVQMPPYPARRIQSERRKNGFPIQPKDDHLLIASRTVWFGRIPSNCFENDIRESVKEVGQPEKVILVAQYGCAYVTMHERRAAFKIVDRLGKNLQIAKKSVKISWAIIQGIKDNEKLMEYWDSSRGIAQIPFSKLPERLDSILQGAFMEIHTMPTHLKGLYDERGPIVPGQSEAPIAFPGMIPGMNVPNVSMSSMFPQQIPPTENLFPLQQQLNLPPPIQFGVQANASGQQKQQQNFYPNMPGNLAAFGFPPGVLPLGGMDTRFRPPFMNPGAFIPNTFSATSAATAPQSVSLIPLPNSTAQSFQQQNVCYELSARPSQNTLSQGFWPR